MTKTTARVWATLTFPLDDSCTFCPALRYSGTADQRYCMMTGRFLPEWKICRPDNCPAEITGEIRYES